MNRKFEMENPIIRIAGFDTFPYALDCAFTAINSRNCNKPGPGSGIELTLLICQILEVNCAFEDLGNVGYGTKLPNGTYDSWVQWLVVNSTSQSQFSLPILEEDKQLSSAGLSPHIPGDSCSSDHQRTGVPMMTRFLYTITSIITSGFLQSQQ